MEKESIIENVNTLTKENKNARILEELKTEPLQYVLEIANVVNAEELVNQLSLFETKAGFEKVFEVCGTKETKKCSR